MGPILVTDRVVKVCVSGDLVSTTVDAVQRQLTEALEHHAASEWDVLQMDLLASAKIDSRGLNLIVATIRTLRGLNRRLQILYRGKNVHRTLLFTRLDQHAELIAA